VAVLRDHRPLARHPKREHRDERGSWRHRDAGHPSVDEAHQYGDPRGRRDDSKGRPDAHRSSLVHRHPWVGACQGVAE